MNLSWLPLTDYSLKYKVSVSTLRRRIKTEDIQFRFEDGKYMILDEPPSLNVGAPPARAVRPSLKSYTARERGDFSLSPSTEDIDFDEYEPQTNYRFESRTEPKTDIKTDAKTGPKIEQRIDPKTEFRSETNSENSEQKILEVANNLLGELKKAYSQILQEKEEQILNLKQEMADLKTLVRVLEANNPNTKEAYREPHIS